MGKSRVAVRLKEKVRGSKSHNKSEDLTRLTEKYDAFCKRLQSLVNVRNRVDERRRKILRAFKNIVNIRNKNSRKKVTFVLTLSHPLSLSSSSSSLHQRH